MSKKKLITKLKACLGCDVIMVPKKNAYEYAHRKYCSHSCSVSHRSPVPYFDCAQCGKNSARSKQLKKHGSSYNYNQKYCSKVCQNDSQRTPHHIDKNGYIILHVDGRDIPEHRAIMEKIIGRPLYKDETVHHKNGVRTDNHPNNLELWSSRHGRGQRIEDKILHAREILETYVAPSNVLTMSEAISGFMAFAA